MVITRKITLQSKGECDVIDITPKVNEALAGTELSAGVIILFITGSTAGLSTIEYESGVVNDFKNMWKRLVPESIPYEHDSRWGDGNGYSHVRASLLGVSLAVPFSDRRMLLGTWQQIVVVDFDNRPRSRQVVIQIIGE